jgi:hypothetical protein
MKKEEIDYLFTVLLNTIATIAPVTISLTIVCAIGVIAIKYKWIDRLFK